MLSLLYDEFILSTLGPRVAVCSLLDIVDVTQSLFRQWDCVSPYVIALGPGWCDEVTISTLGLRVAVCSLLDLVDVTKSLFRQWDCASPYVIVLGPG